MKRKKFNITGLCIPGKHYMVDTSAKLDAIMPLIEDGSYFVINRPRQYGKTTTLSLLEERLQANSDYLPVFISFEGIDNESYSNAQRFLAALFLQFRKVLRMQPNHPLMPLIERGRQLVTLPEFDEWITEFVLASPAPIVLMIDEVDKSSNHQLFLDVLALLRNKYLEAARGKDATFHSIILAGVHDIKSLQRKFRPDDERKYNSPWNIAVDFTVDLSFSTADIETMLVDYVQATGVTMDRVYIAERLYFYTSGYPFLVSAVCKIIDEELHLPTPAPSQEGKPTLANTVDLSVGAWASCPPRGGGQDVRAPKSTALPTLAPPQGGNGWQGDDVDEAVNRLLSVQNTNFDNLIKNLENNAAFATLVEQLVLLGVPLSYNQDNPLIHLGIQYGVLANRDNSVAIHNRVYQERIYNYLTSKLETGELLSRSLEEYTFQSQFIKADGLLDIEHVLLKFQEFMKQEYSSRDETFLERNGRLVFFAFLRPIINGQGFAFKEPQISEEKRLDVVITYGTQKHIIELKIWRGDEKHQAGLRQLTDYLDRISHDEGALVIFDFTQKGQKTWKQERLQVDSKDIFAVWV